ncbi:MAG TPA: glycosyltransferase [Terriglobia bacterium]|nr:glycosyltransferase [Terriglobia bacterium]
MKKVCIFNFPRMDNFHGYSIDSLDPVPYFRSTHSSFAFRNLYEVKSIDQMYRAKYPPYMKFLRDFVEKFQNADLVVLATYNPIHPEILYRELKKPIKILGFTDDPHSTYVRGVPFLWACDGAFFISPSYSNQRWFADALRGWGCKHSYWLPIPALLPEPSPDGRSAFWPLHAPREEALRRADAFFTERDRDLIYVGKPYDPKIDRLAQVRRHFGSRFRIHGRWRLHGYGGYLRWIKGKPPLWTRVRSLSQQERTALYCRTRIGLNMHLSETPAETGNMRMYEVPAHGVMLLCDKAGLNAHERIFEPDQEAVYYDSIDDAIDKTHYYLEHHAERESIARAGFARVHRDYDGEANLKNLLDWALALPRRESVEPRAEDAMKV